MTALQHMAREFTPSPVPHLASVTSSYATVFAGWERIRVEPPTDLDPWSRHHLDDFCRLASRGLARLGGGSLLHADIRADNLLIRTDGTVAVVDWPWACIGAAWFDQLLLCVNSISTAAMTPRSWCGTTWRVSTATTSRPHWRVFVDISPMLPANRPTRAFP